MNIIYLITIIIGIAMQNILKKVYNEKTLGNGVFLFNALSSIAAMMFFILTSKNIKWDLNILLYSCGFALSYSASLISSFIAISCGSLSLTALIISYSLMLPTVYGLFFLKDPISFGLFPGIILLIISLVLINKKSDNKSITFKWIISVSIAFLGNGMCSVIQKMQQLAFNGAYKNEFMISALAITVIFISICTIKKEGRQITTFIKKGWLWGALCGVMNGIVNLFVMILSGKMPVSVMFPLISAGGIIVTYIISKLFYKEQLSKMQLAGFILGILSVIFLNI